eukprot:gene8977-11519_t
MFLDKEIYKARMRVTIEPFLLDANQRAKEERKQAYVVAVGLGLGVWRVHECQTELLLEAYRDVLEEVPLPNISDLDFSYFGNSYRCGNTGNDEVFSGERDRSDNSIRIHFSQRDPASAQGIDTVQTLVVAQYAWDSNSFPGNEYWFGSLAASGDPAAACCSTISELQNPQVNVDAFNDPDRIYSWPKSRSYGVVKGIFVEATVGEGPVSQRVHEGDGGIDDEGRNMAHEGDGVKLISKGSASAVPWNLRQQFTQSGFSRRDEEVLFRSPALSIQPYLAVPNRTLGHINAVSHYSSRSAYPSGGGGSGSEQKSYPSAAIRYDSNITTGAWSASGVPRDAVLPPSISSTLPEPFTSSPNLSTRVVSRALPALSAVGEGGEAGAGWLGHKGPVNSGNRHPVVHVERGTQTDPNVC